jgi:peptide methionine sulfoxide reductase msrA/msrB
MSNSKNISNLTDFEKSILFDKNTERPFTGEYDDFYKKGIYICKNCNNFLYSSESKFDAGCGWPAFDDCFEGAIKYIKDGQRTEIVCQKCLAHMGHVFIGEHLTVKNTRHCVNSISVKFIEVDEIIVGCGCFWGVQYYFDKLKGVLKTEVGYSGIDGKHIPSYEDVCNQGKNLKQGYYEVIKIIFDTKVLSLQDLLIYFFEIHDFSQQNGQGGDIGLQYQSIIFYKNQNIKTLAQNLIKILEEDSKAVATKLLEEKPFFKAELYHQDYYKNNGHQPYCHTYNKVSVLH